MTTARDAMAAWLDHLANERRVSPRTIEAYLGAVSPYISFLEQHRGGALSAADMAGVTPAELRAYLAHRRDGARPLSARSVSQALS
ncbi:MAG TPA: site-specific integrase, partial [Caulobacter sp.]|nr:site-specific integrase [Caulobacter sp.]